MNRRIIKIASILSLALVIVASTAHVAHAQSIPWGNLFGFGSFMDFFNAGLAWLINTMITLAGYLLAAAGFLLNVSIKFTLGIRQFVDNAPGIFTVWKALRDISGLFFIFFLLYAAFMMIIDRAPAKGLGYKEILVNIVVAGVLINFSFFLAGLGIDASNIVSTQIYNQIAPAQTLNGDFSNGSLIKNTWGDGGISDIFVSSLKISAIYSSSAIDASKVSSPNWAATDQTIRILTSGVIAIIVELIAAASLAAVAIAFIARFVMLIFLLAFSPIMVLGFLPRVGEYTKEWRDYYSSMLVFMPVYLLLLYFSMTIISTTKLFTEFSPAGLTPWYANIMSLGVNAAMIIFLINLPLVAAIKVAGSSGFVGKTLKATNSWIHSNLYGKVGGWAARHAVGNQAMRLNTALSKTQLFGGTVLGRDALKATTGSLANKKFGGARSATEYAKEKKDAAKASKEIEHRNLLNRTLQEAALNREHQKKGDDVINPAYVMNSMNSKERVAALTSRLKDEAVAKEVIKNMKDDDFDAIKKSDEISDDDKATIIKLRKGTFKDLVEKREKTDTDKSALKNMVKNLDGKALSGYDQVTDEAVIGNLTTAQLKAMSETELTPDKRLLIARTIANWRSNPLSKGKQHPAYGWLKKNGEEWGVTMEEAGREHQGGEPEGLLDR